MRQFEESGHVPYQILDRASVNSMTELFNVLATGMHWSVQVFFSFSVWSLLDVKYQAIRVKYS